MKKVNKHNPILNGDLTLDENVRPIKKVSDIGRMKNYWLHNKNLKMGRRNWTIFKLGIVTGLRASDLVSLRWHQVFDNHDNPRSRIYGEKDQKTKKINHYLFLKHAYDDLLLYANWTKRRYNITPTYLFPKDHDLKSHIVVHTLYYIMRSIGQKLGLKHIGTHSIRKTFGYLAMVQTHSLTYVMKSLNQRNPDVTLRYIGIDRESMQHTNDKMHYEF